MRKYDYFRLQKSFIKVSLTTFLDQPYKKRYGLLFIIDKLFRVYITLIKNDRHILTNLPV